MSKVKAPVKIIAPNWDEIFKQPAQQTPATTPPPATPDIMSADEQLAMKKAGATSAQLDSAYEARKAATPDTLKQNDLTPDNVYGSVVHKKPLEFDTKKIINEDPFTAGRKPQLITDQFIEVKAKPSKTPLVDIPLTEEQKNIAKGIPVPTTLETEANKTWQTDFLNMAKDIPDNPLDVIEAAVSPIASRIANAASNQDVIKYANNPISKFFTIAKAVKDGDLIAGLKAANPLQWVYEFGKEMGETPETTAIQEFSHSQTDPARFAQERFARSMFSAVDLMTGVDAFGKGKQDLDALTEQVIGPENKAKWDEAKANVDLIEKLGSGIASSLAIVGSMGALGASGAATAGEDIVGQGLMNSIKKWGSKLHAAGKDSYKVLAPGANVRGINGLIKGDTSAPIKENLSAYFEGISEGIIPEIGGLKGRVLAPFTEAFTEQLTDLNDDFWNWAQNKDEISQSLVGSMLKGDLGKEQWNTLISEAAVGAILGSAFSMGSKVDAKAQQKYVNDFVSYIQNPVQREVTKAYLTDNLPQAQQIISEAMTKATEKVQQLPNEVAQGQNVAPNAEQQTADMPTIKAKPEFAQQYAGRVSPVQTKEQIAAQQTPQAEAPIEVDREELLTLLKQTNPEVDAEKLAINLSNDEAKYLLSGGREGTELTQQRVDGILQAPKISPETLVETPPVVPPTLPPAESQNIDRKIYYRGINSRNEKMPDKFFSSDKDVASNYAIDKVGDKERYEEITSDQLPKNLYNIGDKVELADELGFEYEGIDDLFQPKFDNFVKQELSKKGYAGVKYDSWTMDQEEIHLFDANQPKNDIIDLGGANEGIPSDQGIIPQEGNPIEGSGPVSGSDVLQAPSGEGEGNQGEIRQKVLAKAQELQIPDVPENVYRMIEQDLEDNPDSNIDEVIQNNLDYYKNAELPNADEVDVPDFNPEEFDKPKKVKKSKKAKPKAGIPKSPEEAIIRHIFSRGAINMGEFSAEELRNNYGIINTQLSKDKGAHLDTFLDDIGYNTDDLYANDPQFDQGAFTRDVLAKYNTPEKRKKFLESLDADAAAKNFEGDEEIPVDDTPPESELEKARRLYNDAKENPLYTDAEIEEARKKVEELEAAANAAPIQSQSEVPNGQVQGRKEEIVGGQNIESVPPPAQPPAEGASPNPQAPSVKPDEFFGGEEKPISKPKSKKVEDSFLSSEMAKPEFRVDEGMNKGKGIGTDGSPLFTQPKEDPNQGDLYTPLVGGDTLYGVPEPNREFDPNFSVKSLNNTVRLRNIGTRIIEGFGKRLGQDVRTGGKIIKRFKRKARGLYFPGQRIIRVQNINDVGALLHEFGHALDNEVFGFSTGIAFDKTREAGDIVRTAGRARTGKIASDWKDKLYDKYGQNYVDDTIDKFEIRKEIEKFLNSYGFPTGSYSSSALAKEGFAEVARLYAQNPAVLDNSQRLKDIFTGLIATNEDVKALFDESRRLLKSENEQTLQQSFEAAMKRKDKDTFWSRAIHPIKGIVETVKRHGWKAAFVDSSVILEEMSEKQLDQNPNTPGAKLAINRYLSMIGGLGKVEQYVGRKPFLLDKDGNPVPVDDAKSFMDIMGEIINDPEARHEFEYYLIAKKNIELYENGKGKAATHTLAESQKLVDETEKKYGPDRLKEWSKDVYKYQGVLLQYYRDAGMISQETYQKIKDANEFYVPFQRFFDEFEEDGSLQTIQRTLTQKAPNKVRMIKGSLREIIAPLESILQNTSDLIASADRNMALSALVEAAKQIGDSTVQEIPKTSVKRVMTTEGEMWAYENQPPHTRIVVVKESGKDKYYELPTEMHDALFANSGQYGKWIQALALPSRILQTGAVSLEPGFGIFNFVTDQFTAYMRSEHGYVPFYDALRGWRSLAKKDANYQAFLSSGGDQAFLLATDNLLNEEEFEKAAKRSQVRGFFDRAKDYAEHPLEMFKDLNKALEAGTRVGAFKRTFEETGDLYTAMREARGITADYAMKGLLMRNVSPLYPFLAARINQTFNVIPKSIKSRHNNPKKFLLKGIMGITLPQIGLSIWNNMWNAADPPEEKPYEELPAIYKHKFFLVRIPGTKMHMPVAPKRFLSMAFAAPAEFFIDWMFRNRPGEVGPLIQAAYQEYFPIAPTSPESAIASLLPAAISPSVQVFLANKNVYTGQKILSESEKRREPSEQYDNRTSHIIKAIAPPGVSPKRLEALLKMHGGAMMSYPMVFADEVMETLGWAEAKPDEKFSVMGIQFRDVPLLRRFLPIESTGEKSKSIQEFYSKLDDLETLSKSVLKEGTDATIDYEEVMRKVPKGTKKYEELQWYYKNRKQVEDFRAAINGVRVMNLEVLRGDTPNKTEETDKLKGKMLIVAHRFQKAYEEKKKFDMMSTLDEVFEYMKERRAKKAEDKEKVLDEFGVEQPKKKAFKW